MENRRYDVEFIPIHTQSSDIQIAEQFPPCSSHADSLFSFLHPHFVMTIFFAAAVAALALYHLWSHFFLSYSLLEMGSHTNNIGLAVVCVVGVRAHFCALQPCEELRGMPKSRIEHLEHFQHLDSTTTATHWKWQRAQNGNRVGSCWLSPKPCCSLKACCVSRTHSP